MEGSPHYLVSFEDVKASAGGVDISSIVEIHVQAVANDIPSVTLLVDAGHPGGGKTEAADGMSLSAASGVYQTFRGQVRTAELSLTVTARAVGASGADVQTLSINGWILTDISLSPVQEGGVSTVALTFMHPVCKANFGGAVPGLLAREPNLINMQDKNPLSTFVTALGLYATAPRIDSPRQVDVADVPDVIDVRTKLIDHLRKATTALSSTVRWEGSGLPAPSSGVDPAYIRAGIAAYAMPSGGTSVFQRLVSGLIPECSLALVGDYTSGSLALRPFEPWADPNVTIDESDITSLQFPQSDPSPISGVHILSEDTADTIHDSYQFDSAQTDNQPADIFYVPWSELDAELLYGPIVQIAEPGWLTRAKAAQLNAGSDTGNADMPAAKADNLQTPTNTDPGNPTPLFAPAGDKLPSIDYSNAMVAFGKAFYETSLMKDWSFTVNCRLIFAKGGTLCPGQVLAVRSASGASLAGYVTAVVHTISVASRSAKTSIICTHPRIGQRPESITGAKNALYT